jgi:hypothetical protein
LHNVSGETINQIVTLDPRKIDLLVFFYLTASLCISKQSLACGVAVADMLQCDQIRRILSDWANFVRLGEFCQIGRILSDRANLGRLGEFWQIGGIWADWVIVFFFRFLSYYF